MKTFFASISLLALASTGCSLVGCDRVFPKLTWYWSNEAKRCRGELVHPPVPTDPPWTNGIIGEFPR